MGLFRNVTRSHLFECAKATRQADKGTHPFRHFNFALMHRVDDDLVTCERT